MLGTTVSGSFRGVGVNIPRFQEADILKIVSKYL